MHSLIILHPIALLTHITYAVICIHVPYPWEHFFLNAKGDANNNIFIFLKTLIEELLKDRKTISEILLIKLYNYYFKCLTYKLIISVKDRKKQSAKISSYKT